MPAFYTHHLVAREALRRLPSDTQAAARHSLPLYLFGAQGADFCFFYPSVNPKSKNLGSYLHREGSFSAFLILKSLAADPDVLSYALGYITHYAADQTFHPYVYATAGNSPLRHTRLENLLDLRFKRAFSFRGNGRQKLSAAERDVLLFIYTALAVKSGFTPPKKSAFFRAVSLFNAYLLLPDALFDGANERVHALAANEEKRTWAYPADPKLVRDESADELFEISVRLAAELMEIFFQSVKQKTPLSQALFGKSFLTGV